MSADDEIRISRGSMFCGFCGRLRQKSDSMNMPKNIPDLIPTRRSLLSRLRDLGDQESWSDFFHSYWRLIYEGALKAGRSDTEAQAGGQEPVIYMGKQMPGLRHD